MCPADFAALTCQLQPAGDCTPAWIMGHATFLLQAHSAQTQQGLSRVVSGAETADLAQVSVCPGGVPTGYTYFIPQEEHLESRVVTRAYMESRMVVGMAGRCGGPNPPAVCALCSYGAL